MKQVFNFSAGPAVLPKSVLLEAQQELLDYQGSGMSVMEMSHRSKIYDEIFQETKRLLKEIVNIPDNYEILFIQGGASLQFSMIPMNLMKNGKADYLVTGLFSKKAAEEASLFLDVNIVASGKETNFTSIPDLTNLEIQDDADYVYICQNNTIYGTTFTSLPDCKGKPLVADVSSCFLSEPIDVSKYGILFAGAQKNIGPAGVCVVIIRKDLIPEQLPNPTPTLLQYKTYEDNDSMYNTPPTFTIYMCKKVFEWIKSIGGLEALHKMNQDKANYLYDAIDQSKLFRCPVDKKDRSLMNVPFVTGSDEIDKQFIKEATFLGFENLKGHRSVGGMRASIYNAMPMEGIEKLVQFMKDFEEKGGY